jgi:hypothetical protein
MLTGLKKPVAGCGRRGNLDRSKPFTQFHYAPEKLPLQRFFRNALQQIGALK